MATTDSPPNVQTFYFASIGRRLVAFIIDGIIVGLFNLFITQLAIHTAWVSAFAGLINLGVAVLYPVYLIGTYGQTLGQMALGVKVVTYTGEIPDYNAAIVRFVVSILSALALWIGFLWVFFNPQRQTWHDLAAKTYVIRSNHG